MLLLLVIGLGQMEVERHAPVAGQLGEGSEGGLVAGVRSMGRHHRVNQGMATEPGIDESLHDKVERTTPVTGQQTEEQGDDQADDQLCRALEDNFQGHEDIRKLCLEAPKFGNDDDYVDEQVAWVNHLVTEEAKKYKTVYGGPKLTV